MKRIFSLTMVQRLGWTTGSYAVVQSFRLFSNVVLARLLAPELFGIMLIVNTLRTGVELLSDIGIGQNIVSNKNGEIADFYNTAWSIQILRGIILAIVCLVCTYPIAQIYNSEIMFSIIPVISSVFIFTGIQSIARFVAQKRMNLKSIGIYDIFVAVSTALIHIACAIINPTIWALVYGGVLSSAVAMIASFFVVKGIAYRIAFNLEYAKQIIGFGKWILLSTTLYFFATNIDRIFLAQSLSFHILGIYGVARSLVDVLSLLVARVGSFIIFPMVAAAGHSEGALRSKLASSRRGMLLVTAAFVAIFISTSNLVVFVLYDERYQTAALILPVLAVGVWFSILSTINESVLLGIGHPFYGALANAIKLLWLLIGLPLGVSNFGLAGAVVVMASAELVRYVPLLWGQQRQNIAFFSQDLLITLAMCAMVLIWRAIFWQLGLAGGLFSLWGLNRL